jgi:hypothetical protein
MIEADKPQPSARMDCFTIKGDLRELANALAG